jgi:hypothetical protein
MLIINYISLSTQILSKYFEALFIVQMDHLWLCMNICLMFSAYVFTFKLGLVVQFNKERNVRIRISYTNLPTNLPVFCVLGLFVADRYLLINVTVYSFIWLVLEWRYESEYRKSKIYWTHHELINKHYALCQRKLN